MRGSLANLGVAAVVTAEITSLPACKFQVGFIAVIPFIPVYPGVYILRNTMVVGGGIKMAAGEKKEN